MTLLWIEGFDGQTANLASAYDPLAFNGGAFGFTTGRFGSGTCVYGGGYNQGGDFRRNLGSAKTTIYTGVSARESTAYNGFEPLLFEFLSGGTSMLNLRINPTNASPAGRIRVYRQTDATVLGTASAIAPAGVWALFEMKVVCGTGTSGSVIVRMNGIEIINVSGISTGSTSIDAVSLCTRNDPYGASDMYIDDWWICDSSGSLNNNFLGDLRIVNVVPTGAGSSTQLTPSAGSNWDCVNEVPPSTADYVGHATVGNKDLYAYADLPAGYTNIRGAKVAAYAKASDAGAIKGRNICLSGATTGNGADNTLSATTQIFQDMYELDPNTSAQWTATNFNAAQFGWEVRT